MKNIVLFLHLLSFHAFAQKQEVFRIDSLPKEGILLDKSWKWYAGDNPDFAKADFDDSTWESIDPTKDLNDLPQIRKNPIGWFRIKFHIDSNLINKPFTFQVNQSTQTIQPLENENYFCGMISNHPSMKEVFGLIRSLEQSTTPVLIQGETGTGKELVARAIHENSLRRSQRFISVNCGAIAKELIESELFGHEKGAFTGAAFQREGLFELANGGTLFLDEIGELPIELQPKLLRVLESGEIRRVGSSKNIHVNVRIVTATHRNLSLEVREKRFREDLYYRIYALPVTLPALRQRLSDIDLLTRHFLKDLKSIHPKALEKLHMHSWPGNIRELKNVI